MLYETKDMKGRSEDYIEELYDGSQARSQDFAKGGGFFEKWKQQ